MKELPDLKQLKDSDKDALIQTLWDELQKLREKKPKKTAKNSSLPPAQGFKAAVRAPSGSKEIKRSASVGREGGGRKLSDNPDQIIRAEVKSCKTCGVSLSGTLQQLMQRYDKVEIPPIRPVVTQVERYGCSCPGCGEVQLAAVPVGLEPGSPFGDGVAALGSV